MSIKRRQRGLTMVELIIFIVIVGVAVVGILQVLTLNTRSSADPASSTGCATPPPHSVGP